ncbi:MAG: AAA family ATPase [Methanobrevibacter sp.]|jgi:hypothetical protein|nr:AAA family ATPase [Candidatus Methanovirga aequatorialis]
MNDFLQTLVKDLHKNDTTDYVFWIFESMTQKLPVGRQDFRIIMENNYLYVDKTGYIHEMIENGDIYFLSRPKRFGKSLLLSTIEELFKGSKELSEGLYIYDKWDWKEKYPIIHVDFGKVSHECS